MKEINKSKKFSFIDYIDKILDDTIIGIDIILVVTAYVLIILGY